MQRYGTVIRLRPERRADHLTDPRQPMREVRHLDEGGTT